MVQRVLRDPKPQPRFISPMECHRVAKLPEGPDWLYEIKQDGYRAIAVLDGNTVLLYSISGLDYTHEFLTSLSLSRISGAAQFSTEKSSRSTTGAAPIFKNYRIAEAQSFPLSITFSTCSMKMAKTC